MKISLRRYVNASKDALVEICQEAPILGD